MAFVSGAGGGIGRECVKQLVREGCTRVFATDIKESALEETVSVAKRLNSKANIDTEVADISRPEVIDALISRAVQSFGRVDYAFNIAGLSVGRLLFPWGFVSSFRNG